MKKTADWFQQHGLFGSKKYGCNQKNMEYGAKSWISYGIVGLLLSVNVSELRAHAGHSSGTGGTYGSQSINSSAPRSEHHGHSHLPQYGGMFKKFGRYHAEFVFTPRDDGTAEVEIYIMQNIEDMPRLLRQQKLELRITFQGQKAQMFMLDADPLPGESERASHFRGEVTIPVSTKSVKALLRLSWGGSRFQAKFKVDLRDITSQEEDEED